MRAIAEYDERQHPPLLKLWIHGAPHRRVRVEVIAVYRACLLQTCRRIGLVMPIDHPIDLKVTFVDPSSPDLDNLLTALYQALDGRTLGRPGVVADDGLIQHVTMGKMFPNARHEAHAPRRLPRLVPLHKEVA